MKKILAVILTITTLGLHAAVINVKDYGAKGDGKADDTTAMQTAIEKASARNSGGVLYIPSGSYRITKTLVVNKAMGLIVRGDGSLGHHSASPHPKASNSLLFWDGEKGGTLIKTEGTYGCTWEHLSFSGRRVASENRWKRDLPTAGILFNITTLPSFGDMIHTMSDLSFSHAEVGIQAGSADSPKVCNSDMYFQNVAFSMLNSGFKTTITQAVDYLFDFTFMAAVNTAFDIQEGGNLTSNNFQGTCVDLVLNIAGGGGTNGTFLFNQTRLECANGGIQHRHQLVRCNPSRFCANIKFISFTDAQWGWFKNKQDNAKKYLCEIGPNTMLSFENSIFHGPVIDIEGSPKGNAYAIFRECAFRFITPKTPFKYNNYGFYKTFECFVEKGALENKSQWPKNLIEE